MAIPGTAPVARPAQQIVNPLVLAADGGVGFLAVSLFTSANPLAGAAYGVLYGVTFYLLNEACAWIGLTNCSRIADFAAKVIGATAVATALTMAMGFTVTFATGVILAIAMTVTHIVMGHLLVDCIKCG